MNEIIPGAGDALREVYADIPTKRERFAVAATQSLVGHISVNNPLLGHQSVVAADNLLAALNEKELTTETETPIVPTE